MDLMNGSEGKIDPTFFSACRLCVSKPGSYQILPKIQKQIKELFDISVHVYDGLPQLLCEDCRQVITKLYVIRSTYQTKQRELISRNKALHAPEDVKGDVKCPEEEVKSKEPFKTLYFSTSTSLKSLDVSKVREKCIMVLPTAESVRAASTSPIVSTTNVELTSAEFDSENDGPSSETECIHPESSRYKDAIVVQVDDSDDEEADVEYTVADKSGADKPQAGEETHVEANFDKSTDDEVHDNGSFAERLTTSVCFPSNSAKIWRRFYICKFCTRPFPRLDQIHLHLAVHSNLIKLQDRHDIVHCCVAINRTDQSELESSAKLLNAAIALRKDSKVKNAFENFYISSLYVDVEECNKRIEESDNVRNLRKRRYNYYLSESDSDSNYNVPLLRKYSKTRKLSSSTMKSGETISRSSKITQREVALKPVNPSNTMSKSYSEIMVILNRTLSSVIQDTKRRNTELDQTVLDLLEKEDSNIDVVWQNSLKSHIAEFVVASTEQFAAQSDGFNAEHDCLSDFEDLSPTLIKEAVNEGKALEQAKALEDEKVLDNAKALENAKSLEIERAFEKKVKAEVKAKSQAEAKALEMEHARLPEKAQAKALEKVQAIEKGKAHEKKKLFAPQSDGFTPEHDRSSVFEDLSPTLIKEAVNKAKAREQAKALEEEKALGEVQALEKAKAEKKAIAKFVAKFKKALEKEKALEKDRAIEIKSRAEVQLRALENKQAKALKKAEARKFHKPNILKCLNPLKDCDLIGRSKTFEKSNFVKAKRLEKSICLNDEIPRTGIITGEIPIVVDKQPSLINTSREQTEPSVIQINPQVAHKLPESTSLSIVTVPETIDYGCITDDERNDELETSDKETTPMPIILSAVSLAAVSTSQTASPDNFKAKTNTAKQKRAPDATWEPLAQLKELVYNPSLADLLAKPSNPQINSVEQRPFITHRRPSTPMTTVTSSTDGPHTESITLLKLQTALHAHRLSIFEDVKSDLLTLAQINIIACKNSERVPLTVCLYICQTMPSIYCINVFDSRGKVAIYREPAAYQSQILKSLLVLDVVKIIENNARHLSYLIYVNTDKFLQIVRAVAVLDSYLNVN